MRRYITLSFLTVLTMGILTLIFYATINFILFRDVGFLPAGRIVFATDFGYVDYLILPLVLLTGTIIVRKRLNKRSFKSLFNFGLMTTLQVSFLFSAFIFVYLKYVDQDYFSKLIYLINEIKNAGRELTGLEKEMLTRANVIKETELYRDPYFYAFANCLAYLIIGALSSLLFATLFRKDNVGTEKAGTTNRLTAVEHN